MIKRTLGLTLVVAFLLTWDPDATTEVQRLLLPALFTLGAYLALSHLGAVAIAVALLAGIHSAPGSDDWITRWVYPGIAAIATTMVVWLYGGRFIAYVRATRDARTSQRSQHR